MKTKLSEDSMPVNCMGASSSTPGTGAIDTVDPLLSKKKKLRSIVKRTNLEGIKHGN